MSVTGDEYTDLSPVGRALDFLPKANTLVSHYFVCGIHPDDVPTDREITIDPSKAPELPPDTDGTTPVVTTTAGNDDDGMPKPRVLFHWSGEKDSGDEAWAEDDADIPPQLLDFCFPKYRKADLRWVEKSAPETAEILTKPQHETEDPFVFLISGETPLFGVCIHRKELARIAPPTTIRPRSAKKKSQQQQQQQQQEKEKEEEGEEKKAEKNKGESETPKEETETAKSDESEKKESSEESKTKEDNNGGSKEDKTKAGELLVADRVPITTRCYCLVSRHALLPLLHDLLTALVAADFGASSDMRRILLNYFLPLPDGQTLPPLPMPLPVRSSALVYAILRFTKNVLKVPSPGDVLHYKLPVTAPATPITRTFRCPVGSTPPHSAMSVILEWSIVTLFQYLNLESKTKQSNNNNNNNNVKPLNLLTVFFFVCVCLPVFVCVRTYVH